MIIFEVVLKHNQTSYTAQKTKFSIKDFSSKCDQIRVLTDRGTAIREQCSFWLENTRFTICRKINDGLINLNHWSFFLNNMVKKRGYTHTRSPTIWSNVDPFWQNFNLLLSILLLLSIFHFYGIGTGKFFNFKRKELDPKEGNFRNQHMWCVEQFGTICTI